MKHTTPSPNASPAKTIVKVTRLKLSASTPAKFCHLLVALSLVGLCPVESSGGTAVTQDMYVVEPLDVGPPFPIGGDPSFGVTMPYEKNPAVAFNGANHLVVWDSGCHDEPRFMQDIFAARVDLSGNMLDEGGIPISIGDGGQSDPAVASDGTDYMVVWQDDRNGGSDIYGARVDPSGAVLDVDGIPIATGPDYAITPSIAFDGTNYLVVWLSGNNMDIHGARVDPSGTVLDPGGIVIASAPDDREDPDVTFGGTCYLVVWTDERAGDDDIYGARVDPAGTVLDPGGIVITDAPGSQREPAPAFDGANFLVVWEGYPGTSADIHGARVAESGAVLDPAGVVISDAAFHQHDPDVAFDGTNYLVVWRDPRAQTSIDIYGARVTPSAVVLDPGGIAISTPDDIKMEPAIAFGGADYLVVWTYEYGPSTDIYGTRVDPAGTALDPDGIVISTEENHQLEPATAFDGTNYMVVWMDLRNESWDIYGTRVSPMGTVLDPEGILISTAYAQLYTPDVAFDGTNYLVVWEDNAAGIYGARVSTSGVVLDPDGILISEKLGEQKTPCAAFDGVNYMVVWRDGRGATPDIYGARVTPAGVVMDPAGILIAGGPGTNKYPAIAFDGTNYMVVWEGNPTGFDWNVYGTRVTPSGTVLDPGGFVVADGDKSQGGPAIAFDGTNYMVVWLHDGITLIDIHGARMDPTGAVLDPTPIVVSSAPFGQHDPDVAFDGTDYVAVWTDYRNGPPEIYAARVTTSGTVLDPDGVAIPSEDGSQRDSKICAGSSSQMLVAYSSTNAARKCELHRTMGNFLNPLAPLEATVDLEPETLNLKSKGKWVTAYIELPESFDPNDIDVATVLLNGAVPAETHPTSVGDHDTDGIPDRMVKFDRSAVIDLVEGNNGLSSSVAAGRANAAAANHGDEFEVTVTGQLTSGEMFSGTDLVRIVGGDPNSAAAAAFDVLPTVFKSTATISYEVPLEGPVSIRVYDGAGRLVNTLVNDHKPAGEYAVTWDRRTRDGSLAGAGVYFIRLEQRELVLVRKVLAIK